MQSGYLACQDGRLIRFNAALDTLWTRLLPYTAPNGFRTYGSARLVRPLPDGNLVVAGGVYANSGTRVYLSKVTPTGQVLRDTVLYRTGGDEFVNGLEVEAGTGNYVFSGYATQGPLGLADLFFGRQAAWRTLSTQAPARQPVLALAAWPNPVGAGQSQLRVRSGQPLAGELVLRDALGRTVRHWPATRAVTSTEGQALPLGEVPAGLYLLTGTAPDGRRYVARVLRE
ncbi:hypothetical protein KBK19_12085 [Microvirga sp. STR05]|uniref:T9SS type A sorting domain-containing protein n=1 Tax=Hymenobacter duratus TaxID=2771356 RepID=A0ABR8JIW6_9BACT|nr:hypothetical protein [Hymenobacter duratus]MBD2715775.1 hypothetical protein [Hymenobacter duratus]MBR7950686.1 hypothetical protein [Microvirga sp. STR05]